MNDNIQKQPSAREKEMELMKNFAEEAYFDEEIFRDQLRCLWTAYCLHYNLDVDTSSYDSELWELWQSSIICDEDTADWSDFDSFDNFMCAHLV